MRLFDGILSVHIGVQHGPQTLAGVVDDHGAARASHVDLQRTALALCVSGKYQYWIHGGGVKDIFKTIKYGYPDKGMQSWQTTYSPVQMQQLATYIRTLKGTNPPNPKAPQGDLYKEVAVITDSAATTTVNGTSK